MMAPSTSGQREGRLRAVFGNLGWLLASNVLMAVLSLIYVGIVTRTLGVADFGRFALITGASQAIATLVSFETWKIVVQYGLEHEARGDSEALARVQKAALCMELTSALVGITALLIFFGFWPHPFGIEGDVRSYALGYGVMQLLTLRSTPIGILRLRDRFDQAALADSVQPIGRLIGSLGALFFWPTVQGFLLGYAAAEILTAAIYWVLVFRMPDMRAMLHVPLRWRTTLAQNRGLLRFMWSTNVQTTLGLASRQVPLLLVGGVAGPAAAGAYRLSMQLANALSKISILITNAAFPELVRSIRAVSRQQFLRLLARILLGSLGGGLVVMLIVVLLGRSMLTLIGGHDFRVAYVMLLWLAGAASVELAATTFEPILLTLHRAGTAMLARGLAVTFQFAAITLLLPLLGGLGASISVFLGAAMAMLLLGGALIHHAVRQGPPG